MVAPGVQHDPVLAVAAANDPGLKAGALAQVF
jgi:hypothetical protein